MSHCDNLARLIDVNPEFRKMLIEDSSLLLAIFLAADDGDRYQTLLAELGKVTDAMTQTSSVICGAVANAIAGSEIASMRIAAAEAQTPDATPKEKQGYLN